ncbi:MAG: type III toxin-antitoxin system ToxN/AbiQ family toxin [Oscillospiraceae bacterium]|nr:type III toxin-antitoxin system ToxN/AbiQ family toxin [Oscillospiraceae bacterium]
MSPYSFIGGNKDISDERYRRLLDKEYRFCQNNSERIQKKAEKIYNMVVTNRKQILTDNSCDFKLLEQAYEEYIDKERTTP